MHSNHSNASLRFSHFFSGIVQYILKNQCITIYLYSHQHYSSFVSLSCKTTSFCFYVFCTIYFFLNIKFRRNSVNLSSIKKFLGLLNPGLCVPISWICHSTVFHVEVLDAQRGPYPVQHCAHLNQDFRNENSSPNRSQER